MAIALKQIKTNEEGWKENSNSQSSNEKINNRTQGRWTKNEHNKFDEGIQKYARNWKKIQEYIGTRTGAQIRSHAQKFFNRLEKEALTQQISDQFRALLEIMNNSPHQSSQNDNTTEKQINSASTADQSENQQTHQKEKKRSISQVNKKTKSKQKQINKQNSAEKNVIIAAPELNDDEFQKRKKNEIIEENLVISKSMINNDNNNIKYLMNDEYVIPDYFKVDSNNTLDYKVYSSPKSSQFKILYDQAIKLPQQNQSFNLHHHQTNFQNKFGFNSHDNAYCNINNQNNHDVQPFSPYCETNFNNYNSQNFNFSHNLHNQPGLRINNSNSYLQMKIFDCEKDSEEFQDKYSRQIQENSVQENSFLNDNNLGEYEKSKLNDSCLLGQQELSQSQQIYQGEISYPHYKKGRSRFGSFKSQEGDNQLSNQNQNYIKVSANNNDDDQELKKKLKLNDGASFVSNSNKQSPESSVLN